VATRLRELSLYNPLLVGLKGELFGSLLGSDPVFSGLPRQSVGEEPSSAEHCSAVSLLLYLRDPVISFVLSVQCLINTFKTLVFHL
jgi:hypothetical protein